MTDQLEFTGFGEPGDPTILNPLAPPGWSQLIQSGLAGIPGEVGSEADNALAQIVRDFGRPNPLALISPLAMGIRGAADVGNLASAIPVGATTSAVGMPLEAKTGIPRQLTGNAAALIASLPFGGEVGEAGVGDFLANESGQTGGIKARTANLDLLNQAQRYERAGVPAQQIFETTGWYKGPDDQWKFTIANPEARLKGEAFDERGQFSVKPGDVLSDVYHDPKLFEAYPHLADRPVHSMNDFGYLGGYDEKTGDFHINPNASPQTILSTFIHESQHGVQEFEGFGQGGTAEEFLPWKNPASVMMNSRENLNLEERNLGKLGIDPGDAEKAMREGPEAIREFIRANPKSAPYFGAAMNHSQIMNKFGEANYQYQRLAGEVEARQAEEQYARKDWSQYPPKIEGSIPPEKQIVKLGGKYQGIPVDHDPFEGMSASHRLEPVDHDPFPKPRINAFTIQQEHDDEVRRLESEGIRKAMTNRKVRQDNQP